MRRRTLAFALTALLSLAAPALACPMCKDSVPNDESKGGTPTAPGGSMGPEAGLPGGFNTSVYVMLLGLFGTMGLVGWTVVKGIRGGEGPARGFPLQLPRQDDQSSDDETPRDR